MVLGNLRALVWSWGLGFSVRGLELGFRVHGLGCRQAEIDCEHERGGDWSQCGHLALHLKQFGAKAVQQHRLAASFHKPQTPTAFQNLKHFPCSHITAKGFESFDDAPGPHLPLRALHGVPLGRGQ